MLCKFLERGKLIGCNSNDRVYLSSSLLLLLLGVLATGRTGSIARRRRLWRGGGSMNWLQILRTLGLPSGGRIPQAQKTWSSKNTVPGGGRGAILRIAGLRSRSSCDTRRWTALLLAGLPRVVADMAACVLWVFTGSRILKLLASPPPFLGRAPWMVFSKLLTESRK